MKQFITKVAIYFIVLLLIITALVFVVQSRSPKTFLFVSNSASLNLKAGFIKKNLDKLKASKIIVLGSSMALNNVNAVMIQDRLHLPTINLAAWGLKPDNFKDAEIWNENKTVIYNIEFPDFGPSDIILKNGFSFDLSKPAEMFNIFRDFKTYLSQQNEAKVIINTTTDRDYGYCQFDECGSVLLNDANFRVRPARWNMDEFKKEQVDTAKLNHFVAVLKGIIDSHKKDNKIIITFSPGRRIFYTQEKSNMVLKLASLLKEKCPDINFINKYDANYPDNLYVDNCHFNRSGATKFTGEVIDSLKKMDTIRQIR
jgi:hypothetical protein